MMKEQGVRDAFKAYAADNYFEPNKGVLDDALNWSWCDRAIDCSFKDGVLSHVFLIDMHEKTTVQGKLETGEDVQRLWDWLMEQTPEMFKKSTIKNEKVKLLVNVVTLGAASARTELLFEAFVYVSAEFQKSTQRQATDLAEQLFFNTVAKDRHIRGTSDGRPTLVFLDHGDTVQILSSNVEAS